MAKAYFIGLGGSGMKTVAEIYKKLCHLPGANNDFLFTYIDTDKRTFENINAEETIIRFADFIPLSETNPNAIIRQARLNNDPASLRLKEWAIPEAPNSLTYPNERLADGAQAIRMIGRFSIYQNYPKIYNELTGKIRQFMVQGANVVPNIWVFASSNGGTGSSMTMDILYMVDRITQCDLGVVQDPDLKLVLFMPKPFIDKNVGNEQYYLNAYAYMWELNAFRLAYLNVPNKDSFGPFAVRPPQQTWSNNKPTRLYRYIIPVDRESDHNNLIDLENLYPTVAEMVYYLNLGNAANTMISNMSNDAHLLKGVAHYDDTRCDWTTPLVAYGYRVVRKPNDELKRYLKTRGMFELIKYGLIGDDVKENDKDKVKKDFANKYIMPLLMVTDATEALEINQNSLQTRIRAMYNNIFSLSEENLDANTVTYRINEVEKIEKDIKIEEEEVFEMLKDTINEGTSEAIHSHGLTYADTLLDLVDDHFLEPLVENQLEKERAEMYQKSRIKQAQCTSFDLKKKKYRGLCVSAFDEYKEYVIQYQVLNSVIRIIERLTKASTGYLEVLRRGGTQKVGIRGLKDETNKALNKWEEALSQLRKEFCSSTNNAFTTYIPSLVGIAKNENGQLWPYGTKFDDIFVNTILNYDANEANRIDGKHIPLRDAEGENLCISQYLRTIDERNRVFVEIALKDKLNMGNSFNTEVLDKLLREVENAIADPTRTATPWLNQPLSDALQNPSNLPAGKTFNQFVNELSDRENIHVLYPIKAGFGYGQLPAVRYVYAGANQALAVQLGYNPGNNNEQFVQDNNMTDRILIMKMPLGLDFYWYSHFSSLESTYNQNYSKIRNLKGNESGCHIHQVFNKLDISLGNAGTDSLKVLFVALYYQTMLTWLKNNKKPIYDEIFGKNVFDSSLFDVKSDTNLNGGGSVSTTESNPLDELLNLGSSNSTTNYSSGLEMLETFYDEFLKIEMSVENGGVRLKFFISPVSINDTNNVLNVDGLYQRNYNINVDNPRKAQSLADGIIDNGVYDKLKSIIPVFERLKNSSPTINDAFENARGIIINQVLSIGSAADLKIGALVPIWKKDELSNNEFLKSIGEGLQNA